MGHPAHPADTGVDGMSDKPRVGLLESPLPVWGSLSFKADYGKASLLAARPITKHWGAFCIKFLAPSPFHGEMAA
jgi:hypothetical protein